MQFRSGKDTGPGAPGYAHYLCQIFFLLVAVLAIVRRATASPLPFIEDFETNTVTLGPLHGQNGWTASPTNTALVQTNIVYEGDQALSLDTRHRLPDTFSSAQHLFSAPTNTTVWLDFTAQAIPSPVPAGPGDNAGAMYFNTNGQLVVYDGSIQPSGDWVTLTNYTPAATGEWVRLSVKLDYALQQWLVCINSQLATNNLGFAVPSTEFTAFKAQSRGSVIDDLRITHTMPDHVSLDGDNLPDPWEMEHFGDLDETDDGDPDGDGLTNLEEVGYGTNPTLPDTDDDDVNDAIEVEFGMDPLTPNAYNSVPFVERFETNTVTVGDLHGQNNWQAAPTNSATVQTQTVHQGDQALTLDARHLSPGTFSSAQHLFASPEASSIWTDIYVLAGDGEAPTNAAISAASLYISTNGYLVVYDGLQPEGEEWVTLSNTTPVVFDQWIRLTINCNYSTRRWRVYLDTEKLAENLGFGGDVSQFNVLTLCGRNSHVDTITINTMSPAGIQRSATIYGFR